MTQIHIYISYIFVLLFIPLSWLTGFLEQCFPYKHFSLPQSTASMVWDNDNLCYSSAQQYTLHYHISINSLDSYTHIKIGFQRHVRNCKHTQEYTTLHHQVSCIKARWKKYCRCVSVRARTWLCICAFVCMDWAENYYCHGNLINNRSVTSFYHI